jgi:toxin ParE1/3/4
MIDWTEQATRQLDQVHDYISLANGETIADQIVVQVLSSIQQLATFPMAGRSGRILGTRELIISNTPFIAAYTVEKNRIVILALYHGAQYWPEQL